MNSNYDIEELLQLDINALYALLDQVDNVSGLGIKPATQNGNSNKGRVRYLSMMKRLKKIICGSEILHSILANKKNYQRAEIVAIIADLLIITLEPITAVTMALIISHHSFEDICG